MTQSSASRIVSTRVSDSAPGRFALESPISLISNGIERTVEEEEEEFSFLVCVCCFLPPQICARSKIEKEEEKGEGEGNILNEEEEEEEGMMMNIHRYRPWFDLPVDILDIIVSHLQFADYVRFGAVCKSWRSVTADTPHLRALQHPWLAILDKSALFSPVEDRLYHQNIPLASNSRCIGSSHGCLIFMNESEGGHIFNPFTSQTLKFPHSRDLKVSTKAVLSSAPLRARDCVLAGLINCGTLGFCRPSDRDLFLHYCPHTTLLDVVFFKGLLYCYYVNDHSNDDYISNTCRHNLMVFEFGPGPEMTFTESHIALDSVKLLNVIHEDVWYYLAEYAGELLMVVLYWEFPEGELIARRTVGFEFYKLDFSVPKWVEVETLGDKMLLLKDRYLRCVDAVDFSSSGFRPNCIYFTDGELDNYQWLMFSLEDKIIQPFYPTTSWAIRSTLISIKPSNA